MVEFHFSRRLPQGASSGFDLGDMEIFGPTLSVSSAGMVPDQGMMIFSSLGLLLDQIREPLASGKGIVLFGGIDSSFQVRFAVAKGQVVVSGKQGEVDRVAISHFIDALLAAVDDFAARELGGLPEDDPVRADLVGAVSDFCTIRRSGWST